METKDLSWPLMSNNITEEDRNAVIDFLRLDPILTNGPKVLEFEEAWSKWLGVKYSVFVNSGASANLITMAYLKNQIQPTNIAVPTLTWVSDISSVMQNGFHPVFIDVDKQTLGMNQQQLAHAIDFGGVKKVFATHVMGFPCHSASSIPKDWLIEDCCEAHGATVNGKKVGTFGFISNFSFYFAHHMSTIEGGMVCTDDRTIYEYIRAIRSHGMVREMKDEKLKQSFYDKYPNVHPSFMFIMPAYNVRSTEINAVIGLSQLKRLDEQNERRRKNSEIFLGELNPELFRTDLATDGACPYALVLILKNQDFILRDNIETLLTKCKVEFRRGLSGGGNQLRQPYLSHIGWNETDYSEAEHLTDFSWYIGNYPNLSHEKISDLCKLLNQI